MAVVAISVVVALPTFGCGIRRAVAMARGRQLLLRQAMRTPALSPSADRGESIQIAGLQVSIWRPAAGTKPPFPLDVFSHGFHGSFTQSTFLTRSLADDGYIVVAPNNTIRRGVGPRGARGPFPRGIYGAWCGRSLAEVEAARSRGHCGALSLLLAVREERDSRLDGRSRHVPGGNPRLRDYTDGGYKQFLDKYVNGDGTADLKQKRVGVADMRNK